MKVCIEIPKIRVSFSDGSVREIEGFDSGYNRMEVVMALLKGQIDDVIDEHKKEKYASSREKPTRSDRRWTAEEMEDFEKNAVKLEFPKMKSTWD